MHGARNVLTHDCFTVLVMYIVTAERFSEIGPCESSLVVISSSSCHHFCMQSCCHAHNYCHFVCVLFVCLSQFASY